MKRKELHWIVYFKGKLAAKVKTFKKLCFKNAYIITPLQLDILSIDMKNICNERFKTLESTSKR